MKLHFESREPYLFNLLIAAFQDKIFQNAEVFLTTGEFFLNGHFD